MAGINDYQGNAELGYGTAGSGGGDLGTYTPKISVDAADKLAYYNFMEQKDIWTRNNQKKDEAAKKAETMLDFSYGDFLDQDRKILDDKMAAYTQAYTKDPTAVTLKLGPGDKPINAEAHANLYNLKRDITDTIRRANKRASQKGALDSQLAQLKGDDSKLADFQNWHKQELTKPFNEDINLFPDIDVFDLNHYLANTKVDDIVYDRINVMGDNNVTDKVTISNVQNLRSQFSADYATKPVLQKAFDSQYGSFKNILSTATNPDGSLNMDVLRKDPGGKVLIQLASDANSFLDEFNKPEVLRQSGSAAVPKVDLNDNLDVEEMFTMLAASKYKKGLDSQIQHTGGALGWAELQEKKNQRASNERIATAQASARAAGGSGGAGKAADLPVIGDKVYRDYWNLGQKASPDGTHFNEIPVTPTLASAFAKQRDNTIKRTGYAEGAEGDQAYEEALQKNQQVPERIIGKRMNGKLQFRVFYPSPDNKKDMVEFNDNDIVGSLAKQYSGGKVQKEVDEDMVSYRRMAFPDVATPTWDHFNNLYTNKEPAANTPDAGTSKDINSDADYNSGTIKGDYVDPNKLKVGKVYIWDGVKARWNGKKMERVK